MKQTVMALVRLDKGESFWIKVPHYLMAGRNAPNDNGKRHVKKARFGKGT